MRREEPGGLLRREHAKRMGLKGDGDRSSVFPRSAFADQAQELKVGEVDAVEGSDGNYAGSGLRFECGGGLVEGVEELHG